MAISNITETNYNNIEEIKNDQKMISVYGGVPTNEQLYYTAISGDVNGELSYNQFVNIGVYMFTHEIGSSGPYPDFEQEYNNLIGNMKFFWTDHSGNSDEATQFWLNTNGLFAFSVLEPGNYCFSIGTDENKYAYNKKAEIVLTDIVETQNNPVIITEAEAVGNWEYDKENAEITKWLGETPESQIIVPARIGDCIIKCVRIPRC